MGRDSSIELHFKTPTDVLVILDQLTTVGCEFVDEGCQDQIVYLLDDSGDFDWTAAHPGRIENIFAELAAHQKDGNIVGVSFRWRNHREGGQLLFYPNRQDVTFMPVINKRKMLSAPRYFDVAWYLERLIPALDSIGLDSFNVSDEPD